MAKERALTLEALRVMDAIDRRGSFAAAADELGRVPSALSYTMQKLEEELDVVLFDRSGHRTKFTNVGRMLLERGRVLVQRGDVARNIPACVACHGAAMTGVAPSIPGLLGLPRDYLNSQLGAWKTGQRRAHLPDCMADIARQLTPDDVSAVSAWLAAQPVAAGGKPARTLPAAMPARCGGVAEVPVAAAAAR